MNLPQAQRGYINGHLLAHYDPDFARGDFAEMIRCGDRPV
jgi:hypothetical protein